MDWHYLGKAGVGVASCRGLSIRWPGWGEQSEPQHPPLCRFALVGSSPTGLEPTYAKRSRVNVGRFKRQRRGTDIALTPAPTRANRQRANPSIAAAMPSGSVTVHMRVTSVPSSASASSAQAWRLEEHTSELQSLMRTSYADFYLQKKNT